MMPVPFFFLNPLAWWAAFRDQMPDWDPAALFPPTDEELNDCADETNRQCLDEDYPVVDLYKDAARSDVVYGSNGKHKRSLYKPVQDLAGSIVCIGVHQMGVQRAESSSRWRFVTANEVISLRGTSFKLHPLGCRLIAINRFNRPPFLTYNFEFAGNFEGNFGKENWFKPDRFGRGEMTDRQRWAFSRRVRAVKQEVEERGGRVALMVPHIVAGIDKHGRPNRPLCPSWAVWRHCERTAFFAGIPVPDGKYRRGGLVIPGDWRNPEPDILPQQIAVGHERIARPA